MEINIGNFKEMQEMIELKNSDLEKYKKLLKDYKDVWVDWFKLGLEIKKELDVVK